MRLTSNTPLVLATPVLLLLAACADRESVSFATDVLPVLNANCLECHQAGGEGYESSGFSMASYDDLMRGTDAGPMVIPGDSLGSNLVVLMEGRADPSIQMPQGHSTVSNADIAAVKTWIDQGAKNN